MSAQWPVNERKPGEQVVDCEYRIALGQEGIAQVRTEEARAAGDQYAPSTHAFV